MNRGTRLENCGLIRGQVRDVSGQTPMGGERTSPHVVRSLHRPTGKPGGQIHPAAEDRRRVECNNPLCE